MPTMPTKILKMESKNADNQRVFSNKKNKVTFILSILVITIHMSTLSNYSLNESTFGNVLLVIQKIIQGIAQVAVPLFFIISGVMFYRNYTYSKTCMKWKSRLRTLLIPYLIWNTINTIFELFCSYSFASKYFIGREKAMFTLDTFVYGILFHEYSIFWFVFNLIVFTIFCPLIYLLLKNKRGGGLVILVAYILYCFDIGIPKSLFFRDDSILYYMVGSYIGIHYFEWFSSRMEQTKKNKILIMVLLLMSSSFIVIWHEYDYAILNNIAPMVIVMMSLVL